jgi:hypothetical protein
MDIAMNGHECPNFARRLPRAERIARLNDTLQMARLGGRILVTWGVRALNGYCEVGLLRALAAYHEFYADNDPESDFGGFDYLGAELLWKMDYYEDMLTLRWDDPAYPRITIRLLTIMLAVEY